MKRRRAAAYLIAALALAALAVAGFSFLHLRPLPVEVARAEADVPVEVYGLGTVEARVLTRVGFEIGNTLDELRADHGDRVVAGDVLARLHETEQAARVAMAEAAVARAEADLGMARAREQRAEAVLAQKQQVDRRRQALAGKAVVSEEAAEEARTEVMVAAAELAVARSEDAVAAAALADAGVEAAGDGRDDAERPDARHGRLDLRVGGAGHAVRDVVGDGAGEEVGLLRHLRERAAPRGQRELGDVRPRRAHDTFHWVVEAGQQLDDGRLARARRAHQGDGGARLEAQIHPGDDGVVGGVAEGDVEKRKALT